MTAPTMPDLPIVAVLERAADRLDRGPWASGPDYDQCFADSATLRALIAAIREPVNYTRGLKIAQIGREA